MSVVEVIGSTRLLMLRESSLWRISARGFSWPLRDFSPKDWEALGAAEKGAFRLCMWVYDAAKQVICTGSRAWT